jgi:hypothetical protein
MKTYGGVDVQLNAFITSAVNGGEWSVSRPGILTAGERAPYSICIGGWVGPGAGLDALE